MSVDKPIEEEEGVAVAQHEVIVLDAEDTRTIGVTRSELGDITKGECPICMEEDIMLFPLECNHEFCLSCLDSMCRNGRKECPNCRRKTLRIADPFDVIDSAGIPRTQSIQEQFCLSNIQIPVVATVLVRPPPPSSVSASAIEIPKNKPGSVEDKLISIISLNHDFGNGNVKIPISNIKDYESLFGVKLLTNSHVAHLLPHKLAELLCERLNVAYSKKKGQISQRKECCSKLADHFSSQLK